MFKLMYTVLKLNYVITIILKSPLGDNPAPINYFGILMDGYTKYLNPIFKCILYTVLALKGG